MESVIVLGATGGTGQVIVAELLSRGINVVAFGRSQKKLETLMEAHQFNPDLSYKLSDMFDYQTIVRLPDYYGATSQSAYLQPTLEGMAGRTTSIFFGSLNTPREYVYLPDAAKMIVNIAEKEDTYGENWNIPEAGLISGKEIIRIAREVTGNQKPILPLTKTVIRLSGLFDPFMREVVEMMYLMNEGFVLSGEKYERRTGPIPATPYKEGLAETLRLLMLRK